MNIGRLNEPDSGLKYKVHTWRVGGKIPCPPDELQDGVMKWKWQTAMQTGVEIEFTFEKPVFCASVTLEPGEKTRLHKVQILTRDGEDRVVGVYRGESLDRNRFDISGSFGGKVEITAARSAMRWVLRLFPTLSGELALPEPILIGADFDAPVLYPVPARITLGDGFLPLAALAASRAADSHPDCAAALDYLRERLSEQWGLSSESGDRVKIFHDETQPADGCRLEIGEEGVGLSASTRLGLLYGVERLLELADGERVPYCLIEDRPYKQMRGFHTGLPARENFDLFRRFLKTILIPFRYNQIILEFAGGMRFDSHPEISEAWLEGNRKAAAGEIPAFPHGTMVAGGKLLEKDEVRALCDTARDLGFELIPEVQSFGHVQYITYAHLEIAERDESVTDRRLDTRSADQPPSTYYDHSYCPSNPKSYEIIRDLIDEITEVVKPPRFVHMGHDEIYQLGLCPKCKNIPKDVLYEKHVLAMHDYLKSKGYRMMLWSDMLQPTEKYMTAPAAARLPRDIVMLDFIWYFHFDMDLEDHLLPYGYQLLMGNLYSSHYPRYESRAAKDGVLGGQVSTWVAFEESAIAQEGKFYDLMYTSQMLWDSRYDHRAREVYAEIIKKRIPACRDRLRSLGTVKRRSQPIPLPEGGKSLPYAIREACRNQSVSPLLLSEEITIPLHATADALRFTHTTLWEEKRIAWQPLARIGAYTVRYEDGSEEVIPIQYDGNIRCYRKRWGEPRREGYHRHQGYVATWFADPAVEEKTEEGDDVTLLAYEWINPHPDKTIREIRCAESPDSAAGIVLCGIDWVELS